MLGGENGILIPRNSSRATQPERQAITQGQKQLVDTYFTRQGFKNG